MNVDLFLRDFQPTNRCTHTHRSARHILDAVRCIALICRDWMRSSCVIQFFALLDA
jgi:hypothetical protein